MTPPTDSDILCESCGYVLNGLPDAANCPECGTPAAASSPALRRAPEWEHSDKSFHHRLLRTTRAVLFQPARFYRTLHVRAPASASVGFARIHWACASILLAVAALTHYALFYSYDAVGFTRFAGWLMLIVLAGLTYVALAAVQSLAASLTTWEATYRGLRLPRRTVIRTLHYHAPHYLPVALVAAATVTGYAALIEARLLNPLWGTRYLYLLSAEVIAGAAYLFWTYWIGMRNVMYANA